MAEAKIDHVPIGAKYWQAGDRHHVWVVDTVVIGQKGRPPFAVLVSEDGERAEDVDLAHLLDPGQFTPVK